MNTVRLDLFEKISIQLDNNALFNFGSTSFSHQIPCMKIILSMTYLSYTYKISINAVKSRRYLGG